MTTLPDTYFLPEWGKYFETKEEAGEHQLFELKNEWGHIFYQFIKRPIRILDRETGYYDTITPYGFSGPVILNCNENRKEELIALFDAEFQQYCEHNNIITEYIRFNPWLKNHCDFNGIYQMRGHGTTLYIDLNKDDFFMEEFSSNARRQVRRGIKNNLEIEFDFTGFSTKEFYRLYELMAEKNEIGDYYRFTEEFLHNSFQALKGKQFIISAKHEGKYVGAAFILHHGDYLHYHLAATDPECYHLASNSLIIYEICRWGLENNKKELHLGGAGKLENLLKFKKGFTKSPELDLLIGMKTRNKAVYEELVNFKKNIVEINNAEFFPLYRG
ncbi:GNAT family N-acetyltransferase [Metaplanococcus flavidus]|uniref:GNAT family N-acetyltransferase n=1 Tax=Metaplanococcus flavidus TaxID=569883 RepID=A0ABW3LAF0_9BACL